jgi:hypothetical protein
VDAYRKQLFDFLKNVPQRLYLPGNRPRPSYDGRIGALPPPDSGIDACVPDEDFATYPEAVIGQAPKKHWRERMAYLSVFGNRRWFWLIWLGFLFLVGLIRSVISR